MAKTMGQAKQRGTKEERIKLAKKRVDLSKLEVGDDILLSYSGLIGTVESIDIDDNGIFKVTYTSANGNLRDCYTFLKNGVSPCGKYSIIDFKKSVGYEDDTDVSNFNLREPWDEDGSFAKKTLANDALADKIYNLCANFRCVYASIPAECDFESKFECTVSLPEPESTQKNYETDYTFSANTEEDLIDLVRSFVRDRNLDGLDDYYNECPIE
jgi:hypothetical protein